MTADWVKSNMVDDISGHAVVQCFMPVKDKAERYIV